MGATGPAHATLFTSRQPIAHGVGRNGVPLPDDLPTLAGLLTAAGYRSAAFVSAFPVASRFGFGRGFEHYDDAFGPSGGTVSWRRRWRRRGATGAFDRRGAETVDRALAWLGASARDRPRFLWVHLFDPHEPYDAPAPWDRAFARPDAATRERAIDAYDGEILYADAQLGRLIAAFDALAPGGLLVLAADHGEGLWDHGVAHHGRTLFEEEVRVPLVVRWPGRVAAGARVPQPAHLIDVLPTIAGAAGVAIAGGGARFDGVDLIAALASGPPLDAARPIQLQLPFAGAESDARSRRPSFGLRAGDWKLVEPRRPGAPALFDLRTDPRERSDVAGREPARVAEMEAALARWRDAELAAGGGRAAPDIPADVRRSLRALGYAD